MKPQQMTRTKVLSRTSSEPNVRVLLCHHKTISKSIPIINHVWRTESEKNLQEDELLAETRDDNMYKLIVTGILHQQRRHVLGNRVHNFGYLHELDTCIENISRSRYQNPDDFESFHSKDQEVWETCWVKSQVLSKVAHATNDGFLSPTLPHSEEEEDTVFALDL